MARPSPEQDLIKIRTATSKDAAAISAVIAKSVKAFPAGMYSTAQINKWLEVYAADAIADKMAKGQLFCALKAEQVVGSIGLIGNEMVALYVDPELRGAGLGKQLVEYLEAYARAKGLPSLTLTATPIAEAFYERCGYVIEGLEYLTFDDVIFPENRMNKAL